MVSIHSNINIIININNNNDLQSIFYRKSIELKGVWMMNENNVYKDLERIIDGDPLDFKLGKLKLAIKSYTNSRELNVHDSKDQVSLLFVIFGLLDIPEEEIMEFVSRLNIIKLKQLGIIEPLKKGNTH